MPATDSKRTGANAERCHCCHATFTFVDEAPVTNAAVAALRRDVEADPGVVPRVPGVVRRRLVRRAGLTAVRRSCDKRGRYRDSGNPTARRGSSHPPGRAPIGYAERGLADGPPIVFCHGAPGSRHYALLGSVPENAGVRLVVPERPGYGLSDFRLLASVADWIRDLSDVADALALDRFAVVGYSAGGPYAAAAGAMLAERVTGVGLYAPSFPNLGDISITPPWAREIVEAAHADEGRALRLVREMGERDRASFTGDDVIDGWAAASPEPDRRVLSDPLVRLGLESGLREFARRGIDGYVHDLVLRTVRPLGFRLDDISAPVQLLYGDQDPFFTEAMATHVASAIPDCSVQMFAGEGHFFQLDHLEELFRRLSQ